MSDDKCYSTFFIVLLVYSLFLLSSNPNLMMIGSWTVLADDEDKRNSEYSNTTIKEWNNSIRTTEEEQRPLQCDITTNLSSDSVVTCVHNRNTNSRHIRIFEIPLEHKHQLLSI